MKRLVYVLIAANLLIIIAFAFVFNKAEKDVSSEVVYVSRENVENVKRIEVLSTGNSYILELDDVWEYIGNKALTLNQKAVQELAYDVAVISAMEVIETNTDNVGKYGISDAVIKVTYNDGMEYSYAVGNKILNSNRYYFYSFKDKTVYSITAAKKEALFKRLTDYRKITALKCDINNISIIKFGDILIENIDDKFIVTSPHTALASKEKIYNFLLKTFGKISNKNVIGHFENLSGIYISITDKNGCSDDFTLYLNDGEYYLYIESENIDVKAPDNLTDINIWSFVSSNVFELGEKAALSINGEKYTLTYEQISDLCNITAVDFGRNNFGKVLAVITSEQYVYKICEYNSRYVLINDGYGSFLVTVESIDEILNNVVN